MEAILAPVLLTLAAAAGIGIILAVCAGIFRHSGADAPSEAKYSGKTAVVTLPKRKEEDFIYEGPLSCRARAKFFPDNGKAFTCPGCGDCAAVCPQKAIIIENKTPSVSPALCTGCGKCLNECPGHFITLEEKTEYGRS